MPNAFQKDFQYLDLRVAPRPDVAPVRSLTDLLDLAVAATVEDEAEKLYQKDSIKLFPRSWADYRLGQARYRVLLLCLNDRFGQSASFAHMQTNRQRDALKLADEGRPVTSHVCFSLDPIQNNRYLCMMERAPGLSRARAQQYLNWLLLKSRIYSDRKFKFSLNGKRRSYQNKVYLLGHPSDTFFRDLGSGKINGVSLSKDEVSASATSVGTIFQPKRHELRIKAVKPWKNWDLSDLRTLLQYGRSRHYEAAKVQLSVPGQKPVTVMIDCTTEQPFDDAYIKRGTFQATYALPEAFETINDELANALIIAAENEK